MKNLLVVVDMVNGFINTGALADKNINKITPNIKNLIERAKANNMDIVAFKDCHTPNDPEFKSFPPHCIMNTIESELIPELKRYEKDMCVIPKNTTNGFKTIDFVKMVLLNNYDNVYVTGCCTDICVKDFVTSYLKYIQKNNVKTKIQVFEDACYTFNGANHNAEEMHAKALNEMKNAGAEIISMNKQKAKEKV